MASPSAFCFTFSLALMSAVDFGSAGAKTTPRRRSLQYLFRRIPSTPYWPGAQPTSLAGGQLLVDAGGLGAPSTSLAGSRLLVDTGGLAPFSSPKDSPFLSQMTSPVMPVPVEKSGLDPSPVAYLPLPALLAALRGLTPAAAGVGPAPTVCVHTHPLPAPPPAELPADGLLVPGGDLQAQALRLLLGQLLTARTAAAGGGSRGPVVPDLTLLRDLGLLSPGSATLTPSETPEDRLRALAGDWDLGLLSPGSATLTPSEASEDHLRALAARERSSVTPPPAITNGNPDAEMFVHGTKSTPVAGVSEDSKRLSRLLSAEGGEWTNIIRTRRGKRSLPKSRQQSEIRQQMSAALSSIVRRIGFEKYGESLKVILQDLKPLKQAMRDAQNDLNKVQSTYQKFEADLNSLLEQTRGAQQILLFILSSLFQENIVTRRKLEECVASNQVLTAQLRVPRRSEKLTTLQQQLDEKMRQYDALVLSLLTEKSALEVERRRLQQKCGVMIKPGAKPDPFSLSTLISLMAGLGEPKPDVNMLLMSLFPHIYPKPPQPGPTTAAFKLTDSRTAGAGGSWYQVLVPLMKARPPARSVSVPVPLTAARFGAPWSFSRRFLLQRPAPPRAASLKQKAGSPPPAQGAASGDEFVMRMLQLMLELYNAQPGRVDENRIKGELVSLGRLLLC